MLRIKRNKRFDLPKRQCPNWLRKNFVISKLASETKQQPKPNNFKGRKRENT